MASVNVSLVSDEAINKLDLLESIFSFLEPGDLPVAARVSRAWHEAVQCSWKTQAIIQGIPERLPNGMTIEHTFKELYPVAIGAQVYKKHWGDVGAVPPIPNRFIEMADQLDPVPINPREKVKNSCQLILIPAFITILVKNSSLNLNENGKLIESGPQIEERVLKVPVTPNNLATLIEKCLKKGDPTSFSRQSWMSILNEFGDEPVGVSHWSYQRKNVAGIARTDDNEKRAVVERAGLEVVSKVDRTIFMMVMSICRNLAIGGFGVPVQIPAASIPLFQGAEPPHS